MDLQVQSSVPNKALKKQKSDERKRYLNQCKRSTYRAILQWMKHSYISPASSGVIKNQYTISGIEDFIENIVPKLYSALDAKETNSLISVKFENQTVKTLEYFRIDKTHCMVDEFELDPNCQKVISS